jgi:hypothetical protein
MGIILLIKLVEYILLGLLVYVAARVLIRTIAKPANHFTDKEMELSAAMNLTILGMSRGERANVSKLSDSYWNHTVPICKSFPQFLL